MVYLEIRCSVPCPECGIVSVRPDCCDFDDDIPQRGFVPTSGFCPMCRHRLRWLKQNCYTAELIPDTEWADVTEVLLTVSMVEDRYP